MIIKFDYTKALIAKGDENHIHKEIVTKETNHEIGQCKCGRILDYTVLQYQVPALNQDKMPDSFNMDRIMSDYRKRPEKSKRMVNQ